MDKKLLYRFFENVASEVEERLIVDWIEEKPENKEVFLKERKIFDASILVGRKETLKHKLYNSSPLFSSWIRKIASVAALLTIVFLSVEMFRVEKTNNRLLSSIYTISVPAGQRINVTLPDGTKVSMNSMSELKYSASFPVIRKVDLSGEAYFDVAHDETRPFIVQTKRYNVEVLGTSFNLDANSDSNRFSLALITGKVRITDNLIGGTPVILKFDEYVHILDNKLIVGKITDYDALKWREGLFCFKNTPFAEMIQQMERYYDVKIIVNRTKVPDFDFSGKILINEGVDHALRVLQKKVDFTYNKKDNTIFIN
jgi:transmembrane sensor